jgi:hypothetical protein
VTVAALNEQHYREITRGKTSKSSSSFFFFFKNKGIIGTWFFIYFLLPKMLKMFKNIKN